MKKIVLASLLYLTVCSCRSTVQTPAPDTPIQQGTYRGRVDCEVTTANAFGTSLDELSSNVTLDFNHRGVPIVDAAEIAVGRTVTVGGFQATYTRIEATTEGVIIHGRLPNGTSIAEVAVAPGGLDYWLDLVINENNTTTIQSCYGYLQ